MFSMILILLVVFLQYILQHFPVIEIEGSFVARKIAHNFILYPFIFYIDSPSKIERYHEFIHVEQIKRDGVLWFYLKYALCYLFNRFVVGLNHHHSYLNIPYEIQAYKNEKG